MMDESDVVTDLDQLRSRYEVLRTLGFDSGHSVYAVRARGTDRHFIVKVVTDGDRGAAPRGVLSPWQAHTMSPLDHPNLLPIHAVHHLQGGAVALAVDRRRGRTLAERIGAEGPLPLPDVLAILGEVAGAMAYLQERGVVHGAITPSSIFLDRDSGRARLAPFGVSASTRQAPLSGDRSPDFAVAPELRARRPLIGPAVDMYALGRIGYLLLGGDPAGEMRLPELPADVPAALLAALERCVEPAPRRRPRAAELLAALQLAGDGAAEHTVAAAPPASASGPLRSSILVEQVSGGVQAARDLGGRLLNVRNHITRPRLALAVATPAAMLAAFLLIPDEHATTPAPEPGSGGTSQEIDFDHSVVVPTTLAGESSDGSEEMGPSIAGPSRSEELAAEREPAERRPSLSGKRPGSSRWRADDDPLAGGLVLLGEPVR